MKLLAIGRPRPTTGPGEIALYARAEMQELWRLYRNGTVREMYSPGQAGAVLVVETPARRDAEAALATLPLSAGGLIDFEIIELHPFAAFEVLFAGPPRA